jgi:hypothetical protein
MNQDEFEPTQLASTIVQSFLEMHCLFPLFQKKSKLSEIWFGQLPEI